jgi:hypothetical protein
MAVGIWLLLSCEELPIDRLLRPIGSSRCRNEWYFDPPE